MKKTYNAPEMELILFGFDVLTTSDNSTTAAQDLNLFAPANEDIF